MAPFLEPHAAEQEIARTEKVHRYGELVEFSIPAEPGELSQRLEESSCLSCEELSTLKNWFIFCDELKRRFRTTKIHAFFSELGDYSRIAKIIGEVVSNDGGVLDNASPELKRLRNRKNRLRCSIHDQLTGMLADTPHVFTDAIIVERNGRYVLPVRSNFKKDMPGTVHSYSNSGETVFVEPLAIGDAMATLVEVDEQEKQEIERILKLVTTEVRGYLDVIEHDIATLVELDVLFAKVRFARSFRATPPVFGKTLRIVNGFHPVLMQVNERVIPLNLHMKDECRVLLVSGPNAGGKTVVLKTVGLMVLMAKCGMYIPADEGTELPFYEEVYADIGDEQSIETQLSTFAAHVTQIKNALNGGSRSLVLLDELMSQTSVAEGSALAIAVLKEFTRKECTVLATTHNEELKIFVSRQPYMMNGGMEYADRPTYRLILGIPQPSNALKLARELGIDGRVMEDALQMLDKDKISLNNLFEDLSRELASVRDERQQLSAMITEYEARLSDLDSKKKKELRELQEKYKTQLIKAKRSIEKMIKDFKERGPTPESVYSMRRFFKEKIEMREEHTPYYPSTGELVRIRDLRKIGQVVDHHAGKYKISLDNIYYWVGPLEIEKLDPGSHND